MGVVQGKSSRARAIQRYDFPTPNLLSHCKTQNVVSKGSLAYLFVYLLCFGNTWMMISLPIIRDPYTRASRGKIKSRIVLQGYGVCGLSVHGDKNNRTRPRQREYRTIHKAGG